MPRSQQPRKGWGFDKPVETHIAANLGVDSGRSRTSLVSRRQIKTKPGCLHPRWKGQPSLMHKSSAMRFHQACQLKRDSSNVMPPRGTTPATPDADLKSLNAVTVSDPCHSLQDNRGDAPQATNRPEINISSSPAHPRRCTALCGLQSLRAARQTHAPKSPPGVTAL